MNLTESVVDFGSDGGEIVGIEGDCHTFGEELAQDAVEVLVAAAFPRRVRVAVIVACRAISVAGAPSSPGASIARPQPARVTTAREMHASRRYTAGQIAATLGVSRATLYHHLPAPIDT